MNPCNIPKNCGKVFFSIKI